MKPRPTAAVLNETPRPASEPGGASPFRHAIRRGVSPAGVDPAPTNPTASAPRRAPSQETPRSANGTPWAMSRVLVVFAHPNLRSSRVHRRLLDALDGLEGVRVRDLYELYPEFDVDVAAEQEALLAHDVIVWQHPLFWYSVPPLLKQWIDLVLEHGWAYGSAGTALRGKTVLSAISAGARETAYGTGGYNRFELRELLSPLEQTARLCGMRYLPPWVVFGSHRAGEAELEARAGEYRSVLRWLAAGGHAGRELTDRAFLDPGDPVLGIPADEAGVG